MQRIERLIILELIAKLSTDGYKPVAVWDGYEYTGAEMIGSAATLGEAPPAMTAKQVLAAVDSTDTSTIHFTQQYSTAWGNRGVFVVLGNGVDVISDYHVARGEPFGIIVDTVSRKYRRTAPKRAPEHTSREEQHARYIDAGPAAWDDSDRWEDDGGRYENE